MFGKYFVDHNWSVYNPKICLNKNIKKFILNFKPDWPLWLLAFITRLTTVIIGIYKAQIDISGYGEKQKTC